MEILDKFEVQVNDLTQNIVMNESSSNSSKLREIIYLHRRGLVYASSSCHEWRWRVTTNRGRAACAADVRDGLAHSTWPVPRGPARATKQNKISKVSHRQGTKKPRKNRHAGSPKPLFHNVIYIPILSENLSPIFFVSIAYFLAATDPFCPSPREYARRSSPSNDSGVHQTKIRSTLILDYSLSKKKLQAPSNCQWRKMLYKNVRKIDKMWFSMSY